jgi:hypothetical protein
MSALTGTADMAFRTGNGDVVITLPANFEGEVDARLPNGRLDSDFRFVWKAASTRGACARRSAAADAGSRSYRGVEAQRFVRRDDCGLLIAD